MEERIKGAVQLVKQSIEINLRVNHLRAGPFGAGVAVVVNDVGIYWVNQDIAHAANGIAKSWSPSCPYAPLGIDALGILVELEEQND